MELGFAAVLPGAGIRARSARFGEPGRALMAATMSLARAESPREDPVCMPLNVSQNEFGQGIMSKRDVSLLSIIFKCNGSHDEFGQGRVSKGGPSLRINGSKLNGSRDQQTIRVGLSVGATESDGFCRAENARCKQPNSKPSG